MSDDDSSSGSSDGSGIIPLRNLNFFPEDEWEVDDAVMLQDDNPRLKRLHIGADGVFPHNDDWGRAGECIARHSHLKTVCFGERALNVAVASYKMKALFRGIARSKSISKVEAHELVGEEFLMLAAAFRDNPNLRKLSVGNKSQLRYHIQSMGQERTKLLANALAHCHSLTDFQFFGKEDIDDDVLRGLLEALMGHSRLECLRFMDGVQFGRESGIALATLVQNPTSELRSLELQSDAIDDEGAAVLAVAMAGNRTLRTIKLLRNHRVGTTGWIALVTAFRSTWLRLETVSFAGSSVNDAVMAPLVRALTQNTSIRSLDIGESLIEAPGSWQVFFGYLESCRLTDLCLRFNSFNDDLVASLARSLVHNCTLQTLDIRSSSQVTSIGWQEFAAVLRAPHSALETLILICCHLSDESTTILANSLSNNTKLKEMPIRSTTALRVEPFLPILCNKSTIMDTFESNHTLESLTDLSEYSVEKEVRSLLQINRDNDPQAAARLKIMKVHFSGDVINLQPFIDMKLNVLPFAVAWMVQGQDRKGLNLAYQLFRAQPSMFEYRQPTGKRARLA